MADLTVKFVLSGERNSAKLSESARVEKEIIAPRAYHMKAKSAWLAKLAHEMAKAASRGNREACRICAH